MLFPDGIKCIVCDGELPVFKESGLCDKCKMPENKQHCIHCGRGFFRIINSKTALKDYLSEFSLLKRRKAKQVYLNIVKQKADSEELERIQCENVLCSECRKDDLHFARAAAPFVYVNDVKHLVYKLKFNNGVYLAGYMAYYMVKTLKEQCWNIDFITYAPLGKMRLKSRGYNQAQKLAECVGGLAGLKVVAILDKVKDNKPLSKLTRTQRLTEIKDSIRVIDGITLKGQSVLLIDDVFTTGATAGECARLLTEAGADSVYVLTFATSRVAVEAINN